LTGTTRRGGQLTPYGKSRIVRATYEKGTGFLASAILLRQHASSEAHQYVLRHLICQGTELILKAALLAADHDKYRSLLSQRPFGHNIREIANELVRALSCKPLQPALARELDELSHLYSQYLLRYGGIQDIFHDPNTVQYELVLRRAFAVIRFIARKNALQPSPPRA
jgi:hypothetical protein